MAKVLVLGGTGFVGSHLLNRLVAAGHSARVIARNPTLASDARVSPGCEYRAVDVLDAGALAGQLHGCQALINLVGILNESGRDGAGFERAHVQVVASAIAACQQARVARFIQLSALGAGRGKSHYLRTKGQAEDLLGASDLDWTILRPSVIFGPGDSFLTRFAGLLRLIPVWLPLACAEARMQPVYVGDVTRALLRALEDPDCVGQTYELGGPRLYTLKELVCLTRDLLGVRRAVVGLPDWLSRLQASMLDFVPGKPFSSDNYHSLQVDSVVEEDGLARLGIRAMALSAVAPSYIGSGTKAARYQRMRRAAGR